MGCIYCGSGSDIAAQLTITLDGGSKVTVDVCSEHADDATVRTAKQKYMERQAEIDEVMAKAAALGLKLVTQQTASGLLVPTVVNSGTVEGTTQADVAAATTGVLRNQNVQRRVVQQRPQEAPAASDDEDMLDTEIVERRERGMVSQGGSVNGHVVESNKSIDMADVAERIGDDVLHGKVKMELVEGRGGSSIAIPTKKVNGLGTTHVRIVQTNDQELQRRFKAQAEQSKSENGWDRMRHLGRDGITITDCPICHGAGVAKDRGKEITCPKCKGRGMIE